MCLVKIASSSYPCLGTNSRSRLFQHAFVFVLMLDVGGVDKKFIATSVSQVRILHVAKAALAQW